MITISTTMLQSYDLCKRVSSPEFCIEQAKTQSPKAVELFLQSYDACLKISPDTVCRKIFAYDVPTPPVIPLMIGIAIGALLFGRSSKKLLKP